MAEITIVRKSPCYDVFKIAKDMDVNITDVDDALIEDWAVGHILDDKRLKPGTMLAEILHEHLIYAAARDLLKLVKHSAPEPGENGFYYERFGIRTTMMIERDRMDVVIKTKICFEIGG